jgi:hypothetical protein
VPPSAASRSPVGLRPLGATGIVGDAKHALGDGAGAAAVAGGLVAVVDGDELADSRVA